MSNQPQQSSSQPTPAIVFLLHALWSFVCGLLLSLVSVLYQYATSPNGTFSLQGAVQLGIGAVLGYFVTYFMTHKADQAQWLQGVRDLLQSFHNPLLSGISQIIQVQQQHTVMLASLPVAPPQPIAAPAMAQPAWMRDVIPAAPVSPVTPMPPIMPQFVNPRPDALAGGTAIQPVTQSWNIPSGLRFGDSTALPAVPPQVQPWQSGNPQS